MRFVVFGAGAIGGTVAARLEAATYEVIVVARGPHHDAIARRGLELRSPAGVSMHRLTVTDDPASIEWNTPTAILLAVKSHQTETALAVLRRAAPRATPIACLQNGIANEERVQRWFSEVYGVCVMCPALHLEPGIVEASAGPITGLFDIGRYPSGCDETAEQIAAAFNASGFESIVRRDVMRWKWCKLLMNLGNTIEAACGPAGRGGELAARVRREGIECLTAAGIDFASDEEDAQRRGDVLRLQPIDGKMRPGGSTWQSLARGAAELETEDLNGEIVRLGQRLGIATPANAMLCNLAREMTAARMFPGSYLEADLLARL